MKFVSEKDLVKDKPSADYIARAAEDIHIHAIMTEVLVKDDFSFGKLITI